MNELELLPCPYCNSPAKTAEQVVISCSNYSSCGTRPRVTSTDLAVATAKWNERVATVPLIALKMMLNEELEALITAAAQERELRIQALTTEVIDDEANQNPGSKGDEVQGDSPDCLVNRSSD